MPFRRGSLQARRVARRLREMAERKRLVEQLAATGPQLPLIALKAEEAKGRGRPKGARSWDHAQFSKYMEARGYTDPRVMWAEMISRPVEMLAAELACTLLEAAELQLKASERLAPFVAQELPKAVQVDARGDFQLVIEGATAAAAPAIAAGEGLVIDAQPLPIADSGKSKA